MFKILDCTLRDGGYYNNWDFDTKLINSYLKSMSDINIDYVEIGFRSISQDKFLGPLAYSTNSFIKNLKMPKKLKNKIGVMINASEFMQAKDINQQKKMLNKIFPKNDKKIINFVRIACHENEVLKAFKLCKWFRKRGLKVFYNLMQISEIKEVNLIKIVKKTNDIDMEGFYIADSLGTLSPDQISKIISLIKLHTKKKIGIHTHNNKCLALANSLEAIKNGAIFVDSTVKGMGRGCGNTQTEYLYIEKFKKLNSNPKSLTKLISLSNLINNYFNKLNYEYKWNDNLYYYLSGEYKIHPTYVQEILKTDTYSQEDIFNILNSLIDNESKKYNFKKIEITKNKFYKNYSKSLFNPKFFFKNKKILILGPGKNLIKISSILTEMIKKNNFLVLSLNKNSLLNSKHISYFVTCHPIKLMSKNKNVFNIKNKIIMPFSSIINNKKFAKFKKNIFDYGIKISKDKLEFKKNYAAIPEPLVLFYAIALANSGKAKEIFVAGIDGYKFGDDRNFVIEEFFKKYFNNNSFLPITSITPTRYKLKTLSPFTL